MQLILGDALFDKIRKSKVLVVGAGGIGCELLKNLVLSGFENIEIIDLDIIDVSNLNRQFLFRQKHIGKSKSIISRESALRFNPHCHIVAHHGNIKHAQFGPEYFKRFAIAMNALDNIDARRHVNRMCLASDIPLIDGGTAGYYGQVTTIKKHQTECYECQPKQMQKSFAVCTIRSNPSTMVHCVVWAKLLFERLFGKTDDANAISELTDIINNTEQSFPFAKKIFTKVFHSDIAELLSMKNELSWNSGMPPEPLDFDSIAESEGEVDEPPSTSSSGALKDQKVWSLKETFKIFTDCSTALRNKKNDQGGTLEFDKDDDLALNFVASAANLRAFNFHIVNESRFDVKAMAGNIVPAIATTNAIISATMVLEAIKVLGDRLDECKMIYCMRNTRRSMRKDCFLYPTDINKPNPDCYACSSNFVTVVCNTNITPLGYFVNEIMRQHLGLMDPMITVGSDLVFECGEDIVGAEKEHNDRQLEKMLKDVNITNNTVVEVEDFMLDISWQITVIHSELEIEEFEVHGKSSEIKTHSGKRSGDEEVDQENLPKLQPTPVAAASDEVIVLDGEEEGKLQENRNRKRKREDGDSDSENQEELSNKRQKQQQDDNVVLLD